jgi:GNAT superfamily N-acetyltransferase
VRVEPMRADELPTLIAWASAEGWNPGRHDIEIAWLVDPDAFVVVRDGHEMIGAGSVFSYAGAFGFMGLFIVKPEHRGRGLGTALWYRRRELMLGRLQSGAAIGMDGVFDMVPFYERGGFTLAYRDLRFDGVAPDDPAPGAGGVVELSVVPWNAIAAYDDRHVAAPRHSFLRRWLAAPESMAVGMVDDGDLVGMAALRACRNGYRFGPVHANTPAIAETLIRSLLARIPGAAVQIDVPEPNAAGLAIAAALGMTESFGCARMYLGEAPALPVDRIFGVTSFEFG